MGALKKRLKYTPKTYVNIDSNLNKSWVGPIYESSVFKIYFDFVSISKNQSSYFQGFAVFLNTLTLYIFKTFRNVNYVTPSDANWSRSMLISK